MQGSERHSAMSDIPVEWQAPVVACNADQAKLRGLAQQAREAGESNVADAISAHARDRENLAQRLAAEAAQRRKAIQEKERKEQDEKARLAREAAATAEAERRRVAAAKRAATSNSSSSSTSSSSYNEFAAVDVGDVIVRVFRGIAFAIGGVLLGGFGGAILFVPTCICSGRGAADNIFLVFAILGGVVGFFVGLLSDGSGGGSSSVY